MKSFRSIIAVVSLWAGMFFSLPAAAQSTPQKGILEVNSEPQGAEVSVGDESPEFRQTLGQTPLRTEMDAGPLTLILSLDGYETAQAAVDVQPGKTAVMQVKLEKEAKYSLKRLRLVGHLMLWPGLAAAGTGIALIAVDDPAQDIDTGMPGFITAGVGTAMTIAGALILGLTYRASSVYTMPAVSLSGTSDGRGGGISIQKAF